MALFTLATGLRQRNVKQLRWADVDLDKQHAWVQADNAMKVIDADTQSRTADLLITNQTVKAHDANAAYFPNSHCRAPKAT